MMTSTSKEARRIRGLFAGISRRYDLLNRILSWNLDGSWRRRAAQALGLRPGMKVLDLCTGTADLALEICRVFPAAAGGGSGVSVVGADFTPEMVRRGEEKRKRRKAEQLSLVVADALHLPFRDASFGAVTVAFGIRNLWSLEEGLREMRRVLEPGGRLACLEFSLPRRGLFRRLFLLYFQHVLPRLGAWISRAPCGRDAYSYLPSSVAEFHTPAELSAALQENGFTAVGRETLTLGVVTLHTASRSAEGEDALMTPRTPHERFEPCRP
jgi:demethylmenaquinone methyltransferase/2-methoxy-6-polyprenyl-1,4-benzoquinol methylase